MASFNPAGGDECLLCVLSRQPLLRRVDHSSKGVPTVRARVCVWSSSANNQAVLFRVGLLRHRKINYLASLKSSPQSRLPPSIAHMPFCGVSLTPSHFLQNYWAQNMTRSQLAFSLETKRSYPSHNVCLYQSFSSQPLHLIRFNLLTPSGFFTCSQV